MSWKGGFYDEIIYNFTPLAYVWEQAVFFPIDSDTDHRVMWKCQLINLILVAGIFFLLFAQSLFIMQTKVWPIQFIMYRCVIDDK